MMKEEGTNLPVGPFSVESVAHGLAVLMSDVPTRGEAKEAVLAYDVAGQACELSEVGATWEVAIEGAQDAEVQGFTGALEVSVQMGPFSGRCEHTG